jgi:hypothetical protein
MKVVWNICYYYAYHRKYRLGDYCTEGMWGMSLNQLIFSTGSKFPCRLFDLSENKINFEVKNRQLCFKALLITYNQECQCINLVSISRIVADYAQLCSKRICEPLAGEGWAIDISRPRTMD